MTDRAMELAVKELSSLRDAGENVQAVLEQSILNDYQGLFEVRKSKGNGNGQSNHTQPFRQKPLWEGPDAKACEEHAEFVRGQGDRASTDDKRWLAGYERGKPA